MNEQTQMLDDLLYLIKLIRDGKMRTSASAELRDLHEKLERDLILDTYRMIEDQETMYEKCLYEATAIQESED